jgi:ABC-2 type transport system ATP-binding protein
LQLHAVLYKLNRKDSAKRIQELLTFVELWERKDSLVKTFSGGMKRRLEIARGLLHHPQILFLDEPTLGLDAQTINLLWNYIERLNEQEAMTIFLPNIILEKQKQSLTESQLLTMETLLQLEQQKN